MAVLFHQSLQGKTYEVRSAGASLRLYTNGAFHSQWNPKKVFQGAVWDCLSLPACLMRTPPTSALILGVGGGTVCHQLHQMMPLTRTVGIDIDPNHLFLARQYFDLNYPNLQLIEADARHYLKQDPGYYDYLVDDLFLDGTKDPERPSLEEQPWLHQLTERLSPTGALIQNHLEVGSAKRFFNRHRDFYQTHYEAILILSSTPYANGILIALRQIKFHQAPLHVFRQMIRHHGFSTRGLTQLRSQRLF